MSAATIQVSKNMCDRFVLVVAAHNSGGGPEATPSRRGGRGEQGDPFALVLHLTARVHRR